MLVKFDHKNKTARLKLGGEDIVDRLSKDERDGKPVDVLWRPEFASYMVEGTPGKPYGHLLAHFNLEAVELFRQNHFGENKSFFGN